MRELDRYIETAALRFFILVAGGLTALFSLLTFVEELSNVGKGQYHLIDALEYVLLLSPSKLLQIAPVSMLLASLLALGGLAGHSELTAMRALGVSERRIAASLLKLAVPILIILFLLAEFVIPPAQQFAQSERTSKLAATTPMRTGESLWAQNGRQYLNVQRFGYGNVPKEIYIYTFSADGSLETFLHAERATIQPDGTWLLTNVTQKRVRASQFQTEYLASLPWHSFLPQQQAQLLVLSPESMPPVELYRYVRDLKAHNQSATRYEEGLWAKVAIPLSMVAMILIAMPFVFNPPRAQNTGQQITIGASIGLVFTLVQQISGRLDLLLNLNPAVMALGPSLLLMALAAYLFRRTHR